MSTRRLLEIAPTKDLFRLVLANNLSRSALISIVSRRLYHELVEENRQSRPRRVQEDKHAYLMSLLHGFNRGMSRGFISKHVVDRLLDVFLEKVVMNDTGRRETGGECPIFLVVSPTGKCNLKCKGCYASSGPGDHAGLDFDTFDRILREKRELWDSHFSVISGGEPFLWRDGGRDLLDIVEKHPMDLFMVYTNATLITDDMARRMEKLGNITPAISIEGFEAQTDARRGKGIFKKTLAAFEILRRRGVFFGISVTPTSKNWKTIMSDEFMDFCFGDQGAVYCWSFQYMPIGRKPALELIVSPKDRVEMLGRTQHLVHDKKIFFVDFWNSGVPTYGCISAGRPGGYFYIDWNGDVMPCVFVPYAVDNIHDVYKRGDNLDTVRNAPFFRKIRAFQDEYGYKQPPQRVGNWLCPCVIRDHFDYLKKSALETNARPTSDQAAAALEEYDFERRMTDYDKTLDELTASLWRAEYTEGWSVKSGGRRVGH